MKDYLIIIAVWIFLLVVIADSRGPKEHEYYSGERCEAAYSC